MALSTAEEEDIRIVAVDIGEELFTDTYCKEVSALTVMFHTARLPIMDKTPPKGDDAEHFVIWWDGKVNNTKGFKNLQQARADGTAQNLMKLKGKVLAFVDVERSVQIKKELDKLIKV